MLKLLTQVQVQARRSYVGREGGEVDVRPTLQLCVEYSNGYSVRRDLGEEVDLEELAGYLEVTKTMVPDQPVVKTVIQIAYEDRERAPGNSQYAVEGPNG